MDTPTTTRRIEITEHSHTWRDASTWKLMAHAYDEGSHYTEVAEASVRTSTPWTPEELATLRAELVETVTRLAGWTNHDVEVIG